MYEALKFITKQINYVYVYARKASCRVIEVGERKSRLILDSRECLDIWMEDDLVITFGSSSTVGLRYTHLVGSRLWVIQLSSAPTSWGWGSIFDSGGWWWGSKNEHYTIDHTRSVRT